MLHLLWLIPLSVFSLWQIWQIPHWPQAWLSLIHYAPFVMAGLGIFIAFWLNRLQPVLILITLIIFSLFISQTLLPKSIYALFLAFIPFFSTLLPLNLFLWGNIPERGLRNLTYFWVGILFLILEIGLSIWLIETYPSQLQYYFSSPIPNLSTSIHLTSLPFIIFIVLIVFQMIKNAMTEQPRVLDTTLVFVLMLLMFGLNFYQTPGVLEWTATLMGFMILLSMIFDAHLMAYTDPLTGLPTRRALYETFAGLGKHYAIAMMDIDHFKKFNDTYGHDMGDEVLHTVAQHLLQVQNGKVFRFGGEEFVVVFKRLSAEKSKPFLEEVRAQIAQHRLQLIKQGQPVETKVTVSFGVAEKMPEFKHPDEVMKAADDALYQAKSGGRNRTTLYGEKPVKVKAKRIKQ